jgi:hypothetical protein
MVDLHRGGCQVCQHLKAQNWTQTKHLILRFQVSGMTDLNTGTSGLDSNVQVKKVELESQVFHETSELVALFFIGLHLNKLVQESAIYRCDICELDTHSKT